VSYLLKADRNHVGNVSKKQTDKGDNRVPFITIFVLQDIGPCRYVACLQDQLSQRSGVRSEIAVIPVAKRCFPIRKTRIYCCNYPEQYYQSAVRRPPVIYMPPMESCSVFLVNLKTLSFSDHLTSNDTIVSESL
jgi:hypothetical protein